MPGNVLIFAFRLTVEVEISPSTDLLIVINKTRTKKTALHEKFSFSSRTSSVTVTKSLMENFFFCAVLVQRNLTYYFIGL